MINDELIKTAQKRFAEEYRKELEYQLAAALYYQYDFLDVLINEDFKTKFVGWVGNEPDHNVNHIFSKRYDLRHVDYRDLKDATK